VTEVHHIVETPKWADGLSRGEREVVAENTAAIHGRVKTAAESIYKIGVALRKVKTVLGRRGKWEQWLGEEFQWTVRTAQRYMSVALRMTEAYEGDKLSLYAPSALYDLAAESTPEEVRQEAAKIAESGQKVTHSGVQELFERHEAAKGAFDGLSAEHQEEIDAKAVALAEEEEDGGPADRWHENVAAYLDSLGELFGERGLKKPDAKKAAACFRSLRKLAAKYA
jgi:hypothetical protein